MIPFKRFTWLGAYSAQKAISSGTSSFSADDSTTRANEFLKVTQTTPVKRWSRGPNNEYIDSLIADSTFRTYVEVGLFMDSASGIPKNYAALVVNTRLWPSLRDAEDSIYYNQGLDSSKDRSQSTLGDIDTRKVWFKLDTSMMDPSYRTQYYVLHDLWHPDSTWLVKNDSNFAIYLKPGDAKFLYIEKGISIRASKTAAVTSVGDFLFNNGRRVAERMKGTRTVETYTRGGNLYVSLASAGKTVPGYYEHSAGDNIATGGEQNIDASNCYRPSICVGTNDTAVAIAYWRSDTKHLHVCFQAHPDSVWNLTENTVYTLTDTSGDYSMVTPVLTPVDDTT